MAAPQTAGTETRSRQPDRPFEDGPYDGPMRISYDAEVDAAYIYLTDEPLMPGRDSVSVDCRGSQEQPSCWTGRTGGRLDWRCSTRPCTFTPTCSHRPAGSPQIAGTETLSSPGRSALMPRLSSASDPAGCAERKVESIRVFSYRRGRCRGNPSSRRAHHVLRPGAPACRSRSTSTQSPVAGRSLSRTAGP